MRKYSLFLLCAYVLTNGAVHSQSLYSENTFRSLVADRRAIHPGDLLTVQILENAVASSSADTELQRKNGIGGDAGSIGGRRYGVDIHAKNDFDGQGRTQRTGRLVAQITVVVNTVTTSGDLLVAGRQMLEINDEKQEIYLEGRVRPQDVNENNVVLSSRLADARISYKGDGEMADRQRPSWWSKLLTWLGL